MTKIPCFKKRVYLGSQFQRERNPSCYISMVGRGRHGSMSRNLGHHTLCHKPQTERVNRKWHEVLNSQSLTNSVVLAPQSPKLPQAAPSTQTKSSTTPIYGSLLTQTTIWPYPRLETNC